MKPRLTELDRLTDVDRLTERSGLTELDRLTERSGLTPGSRVIATARPAFSLLEMMIVLTIMVAMAALSFPRLTRPLTESDVQRAANVLRDEIADCRQAAMVGGEPLFLRLESATGTIAWGGWATLMAGEFDGAGAGWQPEPMSAADGATAGTGPAEGGDADRSLTVAMPRSNTVSLPAGMVVTEVRWTPVLGDADDASLESDVDAGGAGTGGSLSGETSSGAATLSPGEPLPPSETLSPGRRFYLPFLPSGRTRNAVIVVFDTTTGSRAGIEVDAVTGMLRTIRLPEIEPVELPGASGGTSTGGDTSGGGNETAGGIGPAGGNATGSQTGGSP